MVQVKEVSGKPTTLETLASNVVDALLDTVATNMPRQKIVLGIVTATEVGPPATITATVNGKTIQNIRYVGTTPNVSDTVAIQVSGDTYLCQGVLS